MDIDAITFISLDPRSQLTPEELHDKQNPGTPVNRKTYR
jgi:hypothetical protein